MLLARQVSRRIVGRVGLFLNSSQINLLISFVTNQFVTNQFVANQFVANQFVTNQFVTNHYVSQADPH